MKLLKISLLQEQKCIMCIEKKWLNTVARSGSNICGQCIISVCCLWFLASCVCASVCVCSYLMDELLLRAICLSSYSCRSSSRAAAFSVTHTLRSIKGVLLCFWHFQPHLVCKAAVWAWKMFCEITSKGIMFYVIIMSYNYLII